MKYIVFFDTLTLNDISQVGGKNASLGEMIRELSSYGLRIPRGYATTSSAYWYYLEHNSILGPLKKILSQLTDISDLARLKHIGQQARALIECAEMPEDLLREITDAYHMLSDFYYVKNLDVAVRSSATAEDLPEASFAGQQETFLNVYGEKELIESCKKSFASLFTDRAIIYRIEKGFDHFDVAISTGIQKMVRSDKASAGVIFTLDTETGFKEIVMINSSYGLGEAVVKGITNPDEFRVHKATLEKGYRPIIKKACGEKDKKIIYADTQTQIVAVSEKEQQQFSLTDDEIIELAQASLAIEKHYSQRAKKWLPMDIEWAKDGIDQKLYILQARPETVHAPKKNYNVLVQYHMDEADAELQADIIARGESIGSQIVSGVARVISSISEIDRFTKDEILITQMTDPDWVPIMKRARAIVTDHGGRTCHAAIVSRELGISAIVGTVNATQKIKSGEEITVDCSKGTVGYVYKGIRTFKKREIILDSIPKLPIKLLVNIADADRAIPISFLPVEGVGLARIEFIIANHIKIHPMATVHLEAVTDKKIRAVIENISIAYETPKSYFVTRLAEGIASIAAAFYPRSVWVRFSDFKSNEYRNLIGGQYFEPIEANPMLGLRGASRYYSSLYCDAFVLECEAVKCARDKMGMKNIKIMVPFVRTIQEAQQIDEILYKNDFIKGKDELDIIMMCEIPSNALLIDQFCKYYNGFSIGSNDLTQITLAIDRDSELLSSLFDEQNESVKQMMKLILDGAKKNKCFTSVCGQGPSDFPELAQFLIDCGIDSISLNADAVLDFIQRYT